MFASQIVIDTSSFPDVWYILTHHGWIPAVVLTIVVAVAASVIVELYRRHYKAKQLKQLSKQWTAVLLGGISTLFTVLGYFLVFASSNPGILKAIPFVAEHSLTIVGTAVTLYNLRLNKWYQKAADTLNKWSKSADDADKAKAANQPVPSEPSSVLPQDRGLLS